MKPVSWSPHSSRLGPLAAVLAALAVACAPVAAPTPPAAPAQPAAPAAPAAPQTVSLPKPELTSIKIGHSALEVNAMAPEFANDLGLYKKYGIEKVETFYMDGAGKAAQALVAGQMDAITTSGGPVISSLAAGAPQVMVAMHINKTTDILYGVSAVKSAADLKGKSIAISQFGGESHAVVLLALRGLGLTDKDVTIVQIGGQSARIAALTAGSVAAAPVDEVLADEMKKQGFNALLTLSESPLQLARNGIVVMREFMEKNPNTVLALVAADLEATQRMFTDSEKAIDSFAKWTQAKDRTQPEKAVKSFLKLAQRDLRWEKQAWEDLKEVQIGANPAVKDVDVTRAYSYEFLDKLRTMGFNDLVGVPKR